MHGQNHIIFHSYFLVCGLAGFAHETLVIN